MKLYVYCGVLLFCIFGGTSIRAQYYNAPSRRCLNPNNRPGTCVSIFDCQILLSVLQRQPLQPLDTDFLRASECNNGFGDAPHVCCTADTGYVRTDSRKQSTVLFPTFSDRESSEREQPRKAIRATGPLPATVQLPQPPSCGGVTITNKIYSGSDTDLYEFPWMVRLEYNRNSGGVTANCAGSLINQRYVVTAAHCVKGEIERRIGTLVAIRLGEFDSTKEVDCDEYSCASPALRVGFDEVIPHELYNDGARNKEHDIALIRLDRNVRFSDSIRPICLPSVVRQNDNAPRAGTLYTVAGWGRTLRGPQSATKQKLNVPLVDLEQCRRIYKSVRVNVVENQICAGGNFAEDTCEGDSGGPLMRFYNDAWVLEGVISLGRSKCGLENWPAIYTRVTNYDSWIRSKLRS